LSRNTFANLENISCSIKDKCSTGHAPWPKGICTKCQPNPVTLMRQVNNLIFSLHASIAEDIILFYFQPYRHVDNIMFENGNMVNRFLNYWRSSGHQRIGFLYGRYEVYDGVPLGVRAVVAAIYEPPQVRKKKTRFVYWNKISFFFQETSRDSVKLNLPDPHEALIDDLARRLNIRRIGWIFTDLIPDDSKSRGGPVLHHRGNVVCEDRTSIIYYFVFQ
jgi:nuclear protein localization family protein 4